MFVRNISRGLAAIAVAVLVGGCGDDASGPSLSSSIQGHWNLVEETRTESGKEAVKNTREAGNLLVSIGEKSIVSFENGTESMKGTYRLDGKKLIAKQDGKDAEENIGTVEISGDKMTVTTTEQNTTSASVYERVDEAKFKSLIETAKGRAVAPAPAPAPAPAAEVEPAAAAEEAAVPAVAGEPASPTVETPVVPAAEEKGDAPAEQPAPSGDAPAPTPAPAPAAETPAPTPAPAEVPAEQPAPTPENGEGN